MVRTAEQIAAGYRQFRGKCKTLCDAAVASDPSLTLVRGHIFVPAWSSEPFQPHWWCRRSDGTIFDPSWEQFPFQQAPSAEFYEEFDGRVSCSNCGKEGHEKDFSFDSNYAFCSSECYGQFVGIY